MCASIELHCGNAETQRRAEVGLIADRFRYEAMSDLHILWVEEIYDDETDSLSCFCPLEAFPSWQERLHGVCQYAFPNGYQVAFRDATGAYYVTAKGTAMEDDWRLLGDSWMQALAEKLAAKEDQR